jgi:hypothetical protein
MRRDVLWRTHVGVIALVGCSSALQQPRAQAVSGAPSGPLEAQAQQPQPPPEASEECAPFDANVIIQSKVAAKVAPGTPPFTVYAVGLDHGCRARVDLTLAHGRNVVVDMGQGGTPAVDHSYGGDGSSTKRHQGDLVVSGPDGSYFVLLAKGRCLKSAGDCVSWELVALNAVTKSFVVVGRTGPGRSDQATSLVAAEGRISVDVHIPADMRLRLGNEVLDLGLIEQPIQKQ